jgi:hypothetical protein
MPTITVAVSDELKKRMEALDTVNWSAVARKSFEEQVRLAEILEQVAQKSDITEEDAIAMGRELKRNGRSFYGWNSSLTPTSSLPHSSKMEKREKSSATKK